MIDLTTIKNPNGPRSGGTTRLFIIDAANVESIPAVHPVDKVIYDNISRVENKSFVQFDFAPDSCKLSTPSRGNDGNSYFETIIDVRIGDDDPEKLDQFFRMINGLFIIVLDQASSQVKLCGSKLSPLLCRQVNYDAGSQQSDFNGTAFQFRSKGTKPVGYKGGIGITDWKVKQSSVYCLTT
jgi:hypothetical protein